MTKESWTLLGLTFVAVIAANVVTKKLIEPNM